jgi:S-formylglutathione hydrolase
MEILSQHGCFGGQQGFYRHQSAVIGLPMCFSLYLPPHQAGQRLLLLIYLAGLTCTEETFMIKAGAQRFAAEHGLALVAPDTSPRGTGIVGEAEDWEFGCGAGFYLDATQAPWNPHYRMYSYLVDELPQLLAEQFPLDSGRIGLFGHSMGGHGALVLALRNPDLFKSVSAFAPICAPSQVPWGQKAFSHYLGPDPHNWRQYDASELLRNAAAPYPGEILIDQGLDDAFLNTQLATEQFEAACAERGQALRLRRHPGYDHGYYFIASFIEDHIRHHAERLKSL